MKLLNVNALSVLAAGTVYVLSKDAGKLALFALSEDFSGMKELVSFTGNMGHILFANKNEILLSIDSNLVLFRDNNCRIVLKAYRDENVFWHACKFHDMVVVQEYSVTSPSSIYVSEDLLSWKEVVSNLDIDQYSKHFHYLANDPYRNQLIATLGDGNYIRAICSDNRGLNWKPLCRGQWQLLPIVPLKDKIVFGMDSGIVGGGVGIYDLVKDSWKFSFLKWTKKDVKLAQMSELIKLDTGLWVAALGAPQAIVASEDLREWYPLHIEGLAGEFNTCMGVAETKSHLVCCTGENLLLFEKEELAQIRSEAKPALVRSRAYKGRLRGALFIFNKRLKKN